MTAVEREPRVEVRREIGKIRGTAPGPTLVFICSLHGNEPAGTAALKRVLGKLEDRGLEIRGELVGLVGNRTAYQARERFMVHDLNRHWTAARVQASRAGQLAGSSVAEDRELDELRRELLTIFQRARDTVYLVDLHTTSGEGPAFVVMSDTLRNRKFALHFPVPIIVGLEEELEGTLTDFVGSLGHVTMAFEGGQHEKSSSVDLCEAAIWIALATAGLLPEAAIPELQPSRRLLTKVARRLPRVFEIRYRHPIAPGDDFRMEPGFESFYRIEKGQLLAKDRHGEIRAREDGRILMPLYQKQGEDGFFEVRHFSPFWLKVSALLRHLKADAVVHWMPGVRRHPASDDALVVDQKVARFLSLQFLHLLGYRRHRVAGEKLVMTRQEPEAAKHADPGPEPYLE